MAIVSAVSAVKQIKNNSENDTHDNHGDDGKMKTKAAAFGAVIDIAWHTPKPTKCGGEKVPNQSDNQKQYA